MLQQKSEYFKNRALIVSETHNGSIQMELSPKVTLKGEFNVIVEGYSIRNINKLNPEPIGSNSANLPSLSEGHD
jgi:hypothetical protein